MTDETQPPPEKPVTKLSEGIRITGEGGFVGEIPCDGPIEMDLEQAAEWEKLLGFQSGQLSQLCDGKMTPEERAARREERKRLREERERKETAWKKARQEAASAAIRRSILLGLLLFAFTAILGCILFFDSIWFVVIDAAVAVWLTYIYCSYSIGEAHRVLNYQFGYPPDKGETREEHG